jgi:asparagine synthase (glutamine-hydrolysing)
MRPSATVGPTALVNRGTWAPGESIPGTPLSVPSEGPFAAAWTDGGKLHLSRDAIGHSALYWGRLPNGRIAFSNRLQGVLAAGVERRLDPLAIAAYLSCAYVPGTATLVESVRAVPPGTVCIFDGKEIESRPFYSLPPSPRTYASEKHLCTQLRATLEAAVARAMPEGAVGASLSGGIDSSLVVALASRLRKVQTFSLSFGPELPNELEWSSMVAKHCGAGHHVIVVGPSDIRQLFDSTVEALSEPNGDPLTVPNAMLFDAAAAAGVPVVVNGEGGDPAFGGPKNSPMLLSALYASTTAHSPEQTYLSAHQKLYGELDQALLPEFRNSVPPGGLEAMVTPWLHDARWPAFLDRLMAMNIAWKGPAHILAKVESLAARAHVQARSPLFDRRVVDLAFEIPASLKRKGSVEKHLLKEAVRDVLPAPIIDRPKSGMMVPVEAWFQGPLKKFAEERLLDGLKPYRLFESRWLEHLVNWKHGGLRPRRGVKIWLLLTLEAWLRTVYTSTT